MRYHYQKPEKYKQVFGELYLCDHPVYSQCTLFTIADRGLAVIQQRYCKDTKETRWGEIDPWLANDIYLASGFQKYFDKFAKEADNGLYPTVTVRQIMWALKLKPIPRERWETTFDHTPI